MRKLNSNQERALKALRGRGYVHANVNSRDAEALRSLSRLRVFYSIEVDNRSEAEKAAGTGMVTFVSANDHDRISLNLRYLKLHQADTNADWRASVLEEARRFGMLSSEKI